MPKSNTKSKAKKPPVGVKRTPLERTRRVLDISVTERETFAICPRRWELEVLENLAPRVPLGQNLDIGSAAHEGLEGYYITKHNGAAFPPGHAPSPLDAALQALENWYNRNADRIDDDPELVSEAKDALQDELWDMGNFVEEMLTAYHQFAKVEDDFTIHAVEGLITGAGKSWLSKHHGEREWISSIADTGVVVDEESGRLLCPIIDPRTKECLPGKPVLSAKIDLLVHSIAEGRKGLWVIDHKTTGSTPADRGLDFFDQPTGYCYIVWRWLGILPRGVIYNYLIKKEVKPPKINKGNKLSTDKRQLTTAAMYRAELEERGLMTKGKIANKEMRETYEAFLQRGWSPWFQRHYAMRNVFELQSFEERLADEYQDMLDVYEEVHPALPHFGLPHLPWCNYCSVAPICQAIEDGSDADQIIDSRYMQAPDRKAIRHW